MTLEEAITVLGGHYDKKHGRLWAYIEYVSWTPREKEVTLDGSFTAEQLEAMSVAMRASQIRT